MILHQSLESETRPRRNRHPVSSALRLGFGFFERSKRPWNMRIISDVITGAVPSSPQIILAVMVRRFVLRIAQCRHLIIRGHARGTAFDVRPFQLSNVASLNALSVRPWSHKSRQPGIHCPSRPLIRKRCRDAHPGSAAARELALPIHLPCDLALLHSR